MVTLECILNSETIETVLRFCSSAHDTGNMPPYKFNINRDCIPPRLRLGYLNSVKLVNMILFILHNFMHMLHSWAKFGI